MRLFHALARTHAIFDEEHVIAYAGLEPVMRLAERCGLAALVGEHVAIGDRLGVNAPEKVASIVAGMAAGAASIADLDALRHGDAAPSADRGPRAPGPARPCGRERAYHAAPARALAPAERLAERLRRRPRATPPPRGLTRPQTSGHRPTDDLAGHPAPSAPQSSEPMHMWTSRDSRASALPHPEIGSSTAATGLVEKLDLEMSTRNYTVDPG
ncbi:hypothetical protein Acor_69520 [Acrocarpospora corrugata]|uniref:Uncharacterized protein n=1 Tax=Acrocarpospora corrugata TaxID=35763 RepID=A0A5M3W7T9_9ACTN|nr:hypothetical protein [Acrocarpospora corrugata]GES04884.1 hypothetical protein Acor_69520 [Acrocarpospora corrugata]